jgi:DNA polymerase alpha subunit A
VVQQNIAFLEAMRGTVNKYLNHCGRRWVELRKLFSFVKL